MPRCEGDRKAFEAIVLGKERLHLNCGGGFAGAAAMGPLAAIEKRCWHPDVPIHGVGQSVGAFNTIAQVMGMSREFSGIFQRLSRTKLFRDTVLGWSTGRVIDLEFLRRDLWPEFCECEPYNPKNRISFALTNYETGALEFVECDPYDTERMLELAIASSTVPAATRRWPAVIDDVEYLDGVPADPLPVRAIIENYRPEVLVINIPFSEEALTLPVGEQKRESLFFDHICRFPWNRVPEVHIEKMRTRLEVFAREMAWLRQDLEKPIDHPKRVTPPTAIWWGTNKIRAFGSSRRVVREETAQSLRMSLGYLDGVAEMLTAA